MNSLPDSRRIISLPDSQKIFFQKIGFAPRQNLTAKCFIILSIKNKRPFPIIAPPELNCRHSEKKNYIMWWGIFSKKTDTPSTFLIGSIKPEVFRKGVKILLSTKLSATVVKIFKKWQKVDVRNKFSAPAPSILRKAHDFFSSFLAVYRLGYFFCSRIAEKKLLLMIKLKKNH